MHRSLRGVKVFYIYTKRDHQRQISYELTAYHGALESSRECRALSETLFPGPP